MRKFKACYAKAYMDQQNQQKTSWKTIGYANEVVAQDGKVTIHLSLDSIPTGSWDGEIKLFLQDEQYSQSNQQQQPQQYNQQPPVYYEDANGRPTPPPQSQGGYTRR